MWKREIRYLCKKLDACAKDLEEKRVIARHRVDGACFFLMVTVGGEQDNLPFIESKFKTFLSLPHRGYPLDDNDFIKVVIEDARLNGVTLNRLELGLIA